MIFRRPAYYDDFFCKADKCTDNCCIGWEIGIDSDTAEKYRNEKGTFGKRLEENICFSDEPYFILKDERCPFLNQEGLCDVIINMGKENLCQICRDHPRYFEWYGSMKEGGVGLCCEQAAQLILTDGCYADYFESEVDDEPDSDFDYEAFDMLFSLRERVFDILGDCAISVEARLSEIYSLAEGVQSVLDGTAVKSAMCGFSFDSQLKKALSFLSETEPIDSKWTTEFERLKETYGNTDSKIPQPDKQEERYIERLFAYFIWRYLLKSVFDLQVTQKVSFALFSVTVIFALYKNQPEQNLESFIKSAVLYSKQMEYSDENMQKFYFEN